MLLPLRWLLSVLLTVGYTFPEVGLPWKAGQFSGRDFAPQADGTLRPTEQRREAVGTLRTLFAARMRDCRSCHLCAQCQWHGETTMKPRRVSLLLHPLAIGSAPVLWKKRYSAIRPQPEEGVCPAITLV